MADTQLTKEYFDEQFELLATAVKGGFDHVDARFETVEDDITDIKARLHAIEDEVQTLSRNMITKQYLDAKLDIFVRNQERDSLFKRTLLLALEQAKILDPAMRAKLEQLIPS